VHCQLHWPDRYVPLFGQSAYDVIKERDSVPLEETIAAIGDLINEGKVKYWGVSNETTFGLCQIVRISNELGIDPPVSIQNSYSLIHRNFEAELAEACSPRNFNIGLLPWSPLAGGQLTGKYLPTESKHDSADYRLNKFKGYQQRFNTPRVRDAVAEYAKVAEAHNLTMTQLSLAFMKSKPFVSSTIIGATTMQQLKDNIDAFEITLVRLP
jgi:aryl-alcohol dehydrogenase-like predicted oxidoreductase